MSSATSLPVDAASKAQPGASWKDKEQHILPKNRIGIVFFGLMCTTFLAALDLTIVASALPTIVADLGGEKDYKLYSRVGSAYILAAATMGPLYGKLASIFGRKSVLYTCIATFLVGSALCGTAQSMTWLIACRALQGMGGGGVTQLVVITMSDIVSLEERAKYAGIINLTWGTAGVLGPLVGGALAQHVSWRWCFWINLPTGGVAGAILFFFLNLPPHQGGSLHEHFKEFDFVGLITVVSGVVCLLLGLSSGDTTWKGAETISLLTIGGVLLIVFAINEVYTRKSALIPPRLFKTRTTGSILISVFLHSMILFSVVNPFPLFTSRNHQGHMLGASPMLSGVKMLPYALGASIQGPLSGMIVARTGSYRPILWVGWAIMALGSGLMSTVGDTSTIEMQEIYPLIVSIGNGCLFQTPLIALQAAMPLKDMPGSSATLGFVRNMGSVIGITVGDTIIANTLQWKFPAIAGNAWSTATPASEGINSIASIPDTTLKAHVKHAYAYSITMVWFVNVSLAVLGFILVLFVRPYSLQRKVIREGAESTGDPEKGEDMKGGASSAEVEESYAVADGITLTDRGDDTEGERKAGA